MMSSRVPNFPSGPEYRTAHTHWCALISIRTAPGCVSDRKSTRLNSSHTVIYTLSLHDALPIYDVVSRPELPVRPGVPDRPHPLVRVDLDPDRARLRLRSEEHTSELQSHRDLHSFPTRRSSDL